ncbi:hypothetical protein [Gaetbulibacter aestuarii]|uniref:Uncharacterized protein n=1 Tax=Gaetbulibacter aestuarii TaxID=1502358 RepID=A0ABW7MVF0_9FLAO
MQFAQGQNSPTKEETIEWINTFGKTYFKEAINKIPQKNGYSKVGDLKVMNNQPLLNITYHYNWPDNNIYKVDANIYLANIETTALEQVSNDYTNRKILYCITFKGEGVFQSVGGIANRDSGKFINEPNVSKKNFTPGYSAIYFDTKDHAERVFKALKHLIPFYNNNHVEYIDKSNLENKF